MKNLNEYITEGIGSPVEFAKDKVYSFAKDNNFDYDETKKAVDSWLDNDGPTKLMDRYRLTNAQGQKFVDAFQKLIANKSSFDKFVLKRQQEDKSKEDAIKNAKLKKAEAVKEFVKELIDNDIRISIGDEDWKNTYKVAVTDEGNILLKH